MENTNVKVIVFNEDDVHEGVRKVCITHSMIINPKKLININSTLLYLIKSSLIFLGCVLIKCSHIKMTIIIIPNSKLSSCIILFDFFEFDVCANDCLFENKGESVYTILLDDVLIVVFLSDGDGALGVICYNYRYDLKLSLHSFLINQIAKHSVVFFKSWI